MGDIIKRTAFYNERERAGKKSVEYLPFYLVEIQGATFSKLFQPINFSDRKIGGMSTGKRIQVDEFKRYDPQMRLLMDSNRQLMKFQSCEWPVT